MKRLFLISFSFLLFSAFLSAQGENSKSSQIDLITSPLEEIAFEKDTFAVTFHVHDPLNAPVEGASITIWPAANKSHGMKRMVKEPEKKNLQNDVSGKANENILSAKENPYPTNQPLHRLDYFGQWIQWHNGQNTGAVSLTFGGMLYIASRWTPADLLPYEGMTVTHLELYIQDLPISATAKIWQGTNQDNLVQVLSQPLNDINSNSWHVLELSSPYTINITEELWFGFVINDPGIPDELIAGRDSDTINDGMGNKLKIDDEDWTNLSAFGVDGNWNISAFVAPFDPIILYTDIDGQASFDAPFGNYNFLVEKDGYSPENDSFTIDEGDIDISVILDIVTGFWFIKPIENQIYEVGIDLTIPVEFEYQGYNTGIYWLYIDTGDEWIQFASGDLTLPGVYSYDFQIPELLPSGNLQFILMYSIDNNRSWGYIYSNSFNIINNNEVILITYPGDYSVWLAGNTYEIRWNSVNISQVNIHYSLDNGDNWELIASQVDSENGYNSAGYNSFFWQVPPEIEGNYNQSIIRMENVGSPDAVAYSDVFTILSSPVVFKKPLPGQVYEVGMDDVIPIEIEMLEDINADYYIYLVNGNWSYLFQGYFNGTAINTHDFFIPDPISSGDYYFYLEFYYGDQGTFGNIESNIFTIINENAAIEVMQPGSEDVWIASNNYTLTWNSANISAVDIYYSIDNGESWNLIAESVPSHEGYYSNGYNNHPWTVPDEISGTNEQCLIRIENGTDPGVFGISELFTLSGPLTHIIHPNAETVIAAGQDLQIAVSVSQSSWISIFLGDENENWHYINGAYSNTGVFSYNYSDTQWLTPGPYRLIVEHSETGSYEYGEYFNILPAGTQFNVTFNLDMSAVQGFDPDENKVYLTGGFANWPTPGTDGSVEMDLSDDEMLIYSADLSIDPGQLQYKYFSDLFGQGWDGGEWEGLPNRIIQVSGDMEINDEWGVHPDVYFQLEVISNPENGGIVYGAGSYNAGTIIELSSLAHNGFEFINWEDAHGNIISTVPAFEYTTPPLHYTLTANFELIMYTLNLQANPEEGGVVAGGGNYAEGHDVTITADPNDGYNFLYWKDDHGNELTNNTEYVHVMPDRDITLIAYFELGSFLNEISYNEVNLYPNPAESYVIISSHLEIKEVQISDITGKTVYAETIKDQEKQIAVDYFDPGMYFVRIYTQQGVIVKKLQVYR